MKESTTDPESEYYVENERTKQFAYSFHVALDRNGFVVGMIVTPGNTHDSNILEPQVENVIRRVGKPEAVAEIKLIKYLRLRDTYLYRRIHLPYHKHDMFTKEFFDCYLCRAGES